MDQMAGSITASRGQAVGYITDEPDQPDPDDSVLGNCVTADSGTISLVAPSPAPPPPSPALPPPAPSFMLPSPAPPPPAPSFMLPSPAPPPPAPSFVLPSPAPEAALPGPPPMPAWLINPPGKRHRRKAALALAAMTLACAALAYAATLLALKGVSVGAAQDSFAGQLAAPAPDEAGGLPLRSPVVGNQGTRRAIAEFRRRFGELTSHRLTAYPIGLYSEPGRVDPVTNAPAWIMYLGFNPPTEQASPVVTVGALLTTLAGPAAHDRPWRVAPGPAGGAAKCVITVISRTQMAVCGWATGWTMGALMSPTRDTNVTELAYLMSRIRPDLVRR